MGREVGEQLRDIGRAAPPQIGGGTRQVEDRGATVGSALRKGTDRGPVVHALGRYMSSQGGGPEPPEHRPHADVDADEPEALPVIAQDEVGDADDVGAVDVDELPVEYI